MKHISTIALFMIAFLLLSCGASKVIGYTYKPLASEGCSVNYYSMMEKEVPMIVVTVESDRLVFSKEPELWLKTFDGDVIQLKGEPVEAPSQSSGTGILVGGVVVMGSELLAMAQFPISESDILLLKKGISKVRLTTMPIVHEAEFKIDRIGKPLYGLFQNLLDKDSTF